MNPLSERLRIAIEDDIATGKLLPGSHLDEAELAQRFGVSRTPIRETLSLLAGIGLIEARPRRGAVVAQVSPQRMVEMFEVMSELEAMCARLAARRITELEMATLEQAHAACGQAVARGDCDAYFHVNENFHTAIYAASHNSFLSEQAYALLRKLRPYRRLQLRVRNRMQHSYAEHQAILDFLRVGDGEQAAAATRGHVLVQGERFTDLMASLAQISPPAGPRKSSDLALQGD
jgi:DNA-binding GntR family transcriptional regulator